MLKSLFKQLFFVLRIAIAWGLAVMLVVSLYSSIPLIGRFDLPAVLFSMATMALVVTGAFSHLHRVRLIAGRTATVAVLDTPPPRRGGPAGAGR